MIIFLYGDGMLGAHVYHNGDKLVNLTTRKSLPLTTEVSILKKHAFLAGQQEDAIRIALSRNERLSHINITIIPTWRCNLRCSHCFVMHKLKKTGDSQIDVDKIYGFVAKLKTKHINLRSVKILFVGGEATLNTDLCLEVIQKAPKDLEYSFDMTSNGILLDKNILKLYSSLDDFMISLDGTNHTHNNQRKSLDQIDDPYTITYNNIKRLVLYGLRDKMKVQSALPSTVHNAEVGRIFYKQMLLAGVRLDRIIFGSTTPTNINPTFDPERVKVTQSKAIYARPCCKFRLDSNYVIDDGNTVYTDYFQNPDYSYLGTLDDDISDIHERHLKLIMSDIPVLNDDKCKKCPVVGVCWGWCASSHKHYKPSDYCSQTEIHNNAKAAAAAGKLEFLSTKSPLQFMPAE